MASFDCRLLPCSEGVAPPPHPALWPLPLLACFSASVTNSLYALYTSLPDSTPDADHVAWTSPRLLQPQLLPAWPAAAADERLQTKALGRPP